MGPQSSEATPFLSLQDNMRSIELRCPALPLSPGQRYSLGSCLEVRVPTDQGDLLVAVQGCRHKPAIFTYHDLGLNYQSFQAFFNYVDMRAILENFCVYHITAPGQEDGAYTLPQGYLYPSMDGLANQLNYVMCHFEVKSFIGFGVGMGANILARFAFAHPTKVEALALVNCGASAPGWIEWAYHKMIARSLRYRGMTQSVLSYYMWHHFGRDYEDRNYDLVQQYQASFENLNSVNLSLLSDAYLARSDLGISRGGDTLAMPVLNITGALCPHVEDTVAFNGRLNPVNATWMKISDCALVIDENPRAVSQAFRLFLQGEGYVAPLSPNKVEFPRLTEPAARRPCRGSPVIRITENPISEAVC